MKLMGKQIKPLLKLLAVIIIAASSAACSNPREKKENSKDGSDRSSAIAYTKPVSFLSASGDTLATIQAAVADSPDARNEGLMDVHHMPQNKGMLFIFEKEQPLSFWMANTPLSLDIIFVNKEKKIVRIHQNTTPFSEKNVSSDKPAVYVVEVNGGFCLTHDIREGMSVAFNDAP